MNNSIPAVLAIAGTDPSGGAGISADIKAISATGSYAMAVITALVAQNTQGVLSVEDVSTKFVVEQLRAVFEDVPPAAVKMGMLQDERIIEAVFEELKKYAPVNVVFDPVMVAKDGSVLLKLETIALLKKKMQGVVHLITPNLFEAEQLTGEKITTAAQMEAIARTLAQELQLNVLVKGGHFKDDHSADVLFDRSANQCHWFKSERIFTKNTHGTGCTLSSAIASYLAQGFSQVEAVAKAKHYISKAIASGAGWGLGRGNGPVDHFYFLENRHHDSSCHASGG